MKTLTIQEAITWMNEAIENDICFGIRGDNFIPKVRFNNSCMVWDDCEDNSYELNGLCALWVMEESWIEQSLTDAKKYGKNTFIITGRDFECGEDSGEIIILDHEIFAMIVG